MYTVLLVDDEYLIRDNILHLIETEIDGIKVIGEAENGKEALALTAKLFPDIIITDIKMPVMDGLALLQALHTDYPNIQTLILSGYSDFEYARQALQYNVADYVLKPIKPDALRLALQRCIQALAKPASAPAADSAAQKILQFINETYTKPLSLEHVAEAFNYSPKYISNLIKTETGNSFTEYILDLRISYATELLTKTDLEIKEIAAKVGYDDQQYFHRVFKKKTGITPSRYRK